MRIEELIGDLLLRHNCVVIPTFGGFVAGQSSATFDANRGVVLPPRKSLLFNKQLINNDGLLVAAYAKETNLSYDDAFTSLQEQVNSWQRKLAKGERVTIERVGFLFLDAEKNIGFEQDRFNNLLLSSFGLGKVHFVTEDDIQWVVQENSGRASIPNENIDTPIIPLVHDLVESPEVETPIDTPIIPINRRKMWKYVAAAAVVLPLCFYSYWIPLKTPVLESGMISVQDFNPFHAVSKSYYHPTEIDTKREVQLEEQSINSIVASLPEDVEVFSYQMDFETYIPVRVKEKQVVEEIIEEIKDIPTPKSRVKKLSSILTPSVSSESTVGLKHLVVGCFSTAENANRLVAQLKAKGFSAYIVDVVNGLHRVSAANGSSDSALLQTNSRLASLNISGWILRK